MYLYIDGLAQEGRNSFLDIFTLSPHINRMGNSAPTDNLVLNKIQYWWRDWYFDKQKGT